VLPSEAGLIPLPPAVLSWACEMVLSSRGRFMMTDFFKKQEICQMKNKFILIKPVARRSVFLENQCILCVNIPSDRRQ
jgi:hypothetical protein